MSDPERLAAQAIGKALATKVLALAEELAARMPEVERTRVRAYTIKTVLAMLFGTTPGGQAARQSFLEAMAARINPAVIGSVSPSLLGDKTRGKA
jgi:hypothetical protein